ncbi:MAG: hypothetical protein AAF401_14480 [Pseudomonadota bacterium]
MKWVLALSLIAGPVLAQDRNYDGFHACVWSVADPTDQTVYHHCTAPLVSHCGVAKTAKDAVACIEAERDALQDQVTAEAAEFSRMETLPPNFPEAGVDVAMDELSLSNDTGAAACILMSDRDEKAGVAVGQRAVNSAFCQLMAAGDVYGLLTQFKRP